MKKPVAFILLLVLCFQALYPAVFTAWFYANRAAIASRYCVNKQRPMLHCDGKCYLAKKIQAAEEKQARQENAGIRNMWVETSPVVVEEEMVTPSVAIQRTQHFPKKLQAIVVSGYLLAVFKPPALKG